MCLTQASHGRPQCTSPMYLCFVHSLFHQSSLTWLGACTGTSSQNHTFGSSYFDDTCQLWSPHPICEIIEEGNDEEMGPGIEAQSACSPRLHITIDGSSSSKASLFIFLNTL